MSPNQILSILNSLPQPSPSNPINPNLLVFGLGNDSPMWHNSILLLSDPSISPKGRAVFIEDDSPSKKNGIHWYTETTGKYNFLEGYTVNYQTMLERDYKLLVEEESLVSLLDPLEGGLSFDLKLDLRSQLPFNVTGVKWDVIVVDAPLGCCEDTSINAGPGRYASLITSYLFARTGWLTHVFVDDYDRFIEYMFSVKVFGMEVPNGGVVERENIVVGGLPGMQAHYIINNS